MTYLDVIIIFLTQYRKRAAMPCPTTEKQANA